MILRVLTAIAIIAALAVTARAHVGSDGFVELDVEGANITGRVDLAARDLHDAIGLDDGDGALTWAEVDARGDTIDSYVRSHVTLGSDAGACPMTTGGRSAIRRADGVHVAVEVAARCPSAPTRLQIGYRAIFELDAQHRGLVRATTARGTSAAIVMAPGVVELDLGDPSVDVVGFVRLGVWHIWSGIDHVLFLIALLLPAVYRRRARPARWVPAERFRDVVVDVLQIVTAFTLAHSFTLILSAMGWVQLPSRLVETAIAISVALAALNNLVRIIDARWAVAFALGLLHGFGFSSVLVDVGLPGRDLVAALLGFNLGVELGQAAIVAVFLPLAFLLRRTTAYRVVLLVGSAAMCVVAVHWSFERFTS